ncbi:MAG TPA: Gfo/Idh/MocA family oxidoreductase [Limnochordia bacterium]|nr:Gfo/Idh/MocA family oxidoreductase [Limnochordia bacterium]
MKRVKLGIIGCGVIGSHHLKAAAACEQIELAAVADLREEVARRAAEQYGVPQAYTDGMALIADPAVEAVVIAMPAKGRAELGVAAFERGKHVLTEKPVARNAGEVERLLAAQGAQVGACCSSRHRFLPSADVAAELVASGRLGRIRSVYCRNFSPAGPPPKQMPPAWRLNKELQGGGLLVNWGCYDLDYLLGILNWAPRPETVMAQTWGVPPAQQAYVPPGSDAETHYAALIRCEGGLALHIERGEMMMTAPEASWQIIGEQASLRLNMLPGAEHPVILDEWSTGRGLVSQPIPCAAGSWEVVHAGPVQDFAAAILSRRLPKTTLEQALLVQRITDAIYASAAEGRAITWR